MSLSPGDQCFIEHTQCEYVGCSDDGGHIVKIIKGDEITTKTVRYTPAVNNTPIQPGQYYKHKTKKFNNVGFVDDLTAWLREGEPEIYAKMRLPSDVFKGYDMVSLREIQTKWGQIDSPYLPRSEIQHQVDCMDEEITPLQEQIDELNEQIETLQDRIDDIKHQYKIKYFNKCEHQWIKDEEEQIGNSSSYSQMCYCSICGVEKYNNYTKLSVF